LNNLFYQEDASEMKRMMKGWLTGEVTGGWPILILIGEEDFLFLTMIGEEIIQVLMNI